MADPAIVLLVLLAGDAKDPATQAVAPAARRAFGEGTVVLVQETQAPPSDAEALALARTMHATSIAELRWLDASRGRAGVHVFVSARSSWVDRDVTFGANDDLAERGRAIGLTLVAIIGRASEASEPSSRPLPVAEPPPSAPPPSAPPAAPSPPSAPGAPPPAVTSPGPSADRPASSSVTPTTPHRTFLAVEGGAVASAGIGGNALGAGPVLGVRVYPVGPLAVRIGGQARFGDVGSAQASSSTVGAGGGLAWSFLRLGDGARPVELGARLDVLALRHELTRDVDGSTLRRSRWVTASALLLEAAWHFADRFDLIVAAGGELAFGATDITVGGESVAHIPTGRALIELGVRARF